MKNHKMPNRLIPENVAFRVSKGKKGIRNALWEKLFDLSQHLDVPVNVAIEYLIIDWHSKNVKEKGNDQQC